MKLKIILCSAVFLLIQALNQELNAQTTSINIQQFSDSMMTSYCPAPVNVYLYTYGQASGYNITDSVNVQVDFGDGSTYTNKVDIPQNWFWDSPTHTYNFAGTFSLRCIVTGPDLKADTAYYTILVGDTCGNVNGVLFIDANSDCLFNTGETLLPGIPVLLKQNNTVVATSYSDVTGEYNFNVPIGNSYDIMPAQNISNYGYSVPCPVSGEYTNIYVPANGKDFGLTCLSGYDLQTSLSGWGFRPGFDGSVYPQAFNSSCLTSNGQLELILDPLTDYVSAFPLPTSISGDTLRWDFSNLNNINYWWNYNSFSPQVIVNTDLAAQIGDTVCFTTNVTPIAGDLNTANNTYYTCYAVSNSWDPNMKEVSPTGMGASGDIAPGIHTMNYTVHFQNTGNDTAYNIFVLDTLSSNLDVSTFQITSSSHQLEADILNYNVVKFSFDNIMLVDSSTNEALSKGRVSYTIRTKSNLTVGTQIKNTAFIYFDYNPAIVTNTTLNTIAVTASVNEISSEDFISIYPNPAKDRIKIVTHQTITTQNNMLTIYDTQGRIVLQQTYHHDKPDVNISRLSKGIYYIKLRTNESSFVDIFVKE